MVGWYPWPFGSIMTVWAIPIVFRPGIQFIRGFLLTRGESVSVFIFTTVVTTIMTVVTTVS